MGCSWRLESRLRVARSLRQRPASAPSANQLLGCMLSEDNEAACDARIGIRVKALGCMRSSHQANPCLTCLSHLTCWNACMILPKQVDCKPKVVQGRSRKQISQASQPEESEPLRRSLAGQFFRVHKPASEATFSNSRITALPEPSCWAWLSS